MKKLIVMLVMVVMLFSVSAIAAETGTQVYYGAWSDNLWPTHEKHCTYCGWWSAINIVNVSEDSQEVPITIYAKGEKYEGSVVLGEYGIYAIHVHDMMEEFGYDPLLCKGAFTVKVENTIFTYSMFLIHNGRHSYTQ